ncbi:MAG: beta-ketoacyl-ACP synthase III, partial [Cetobacterium sp.]|uniref:beta-ketoacyl-ACP synthase III n=1 Tax=Cetobacterium sp. TaxID=2071632 RepID=UPI002FC83D35
MKERRIAEKEEHASYMGAQAAQKAIEASGLRKEDIQCIIFTSSAPDYIFPSSGSLAQAYLGLFEIPAFDCSAACTGYLYGLSVAKAYIESGSYDNVLLIAADKLSSFVNYQDRNTCVLFGDGASACVISRKKTEDIVGSEIVQICLGTDGHLAGLLSLPAGGSRIPATADTVKQGLHFISMEGKEVFKHAVRRMEHASKKCLEDAHLSEDDLDWLVPHQANARIIDAIAKRFKISDDRVFKTVHKYGNTASS